MDPQKTMTEVNICDEEIYGDIEYFRTFLFSELETEIKNRKLSGSLKIDEVQLVLEPKLDKLGLMCCYYFVNPPTRSLFWLDDWEGDDIFRDCRGALSPPHKGKFWVIDPGGLTKRFKSIRTGYPSTVLVRHICESFAVRHPQT